MSKEIEQEIEYKEIDFRLLKRLLVYLKPYQKYVIGALMLTIATSAIGPLRPYLTKIAIDDYISKNNIPGLLIILSIIFGTLLLHSAIQFLLTYVMQWVGQNVLYDIRVKLFDHIINLSMKFYDKSTVGSLITRVTNDVEVLNELFSSGVVMILADLLLICWIIGFMFYTSWQLALITLTVLPFLLITTYIFRKIVREIFRKIRTEVSRMNTFLNEFISGIITVKLFTQEKHLSTKFDDINAKTRNLWNDTVFYYSIFYPIVEMLSAIALALIIWSVAGKFLGSYISLGTMIAFTQFSEMFFRPIRDLTEKYTTLQSAMAAAERIFGLLDTKSSIIDEDNSIEFREFKDKIEIKDLTFSYDDEKTVLNDISFEVNKGDTIAIVGATGSGKSTIINLLSRFYDFNIGKILIDGIEIKKYRQDSIRNKVVLVMQDVFLFSRKVHENISLNKYFEEENLIIEKVKNAAIALGASDFIDKLLDGYHSVLNERGSNLSAGQRQLISFCRAYMADPEILILDEATSNIDSETEEVIEKALEKLLKNRTSIIIAHRLSTIKRANKIIVLHHGHIKETGSHDELLAHDGIYAKLYKLQYN